MTTRILCLGNPLLADDAFGLVVAERLRSERPELDVYTSSASGFDLLDSTLGTARLLVIDTMQTGNAAPGTITIYQEEDVRFAAGGSPHYIGLFEALRLGRRLGLSVPEEVTIITVEPADCLTVGGAMHPDVRSSVEQVMHIVHERAACERCMQGCDQ